MSGMVKEYGEGWDERDLVRRAAIMDHKIQMALGPRVAIADGRGWQYMAEGGNSRWLGLPTRHCVTALSSIPVASYRALYCAFIHPIIHSFVHSSLYHHGGDVTRRRSVKLPSQMMMCGRVLMSPSLRN